MCVAIIIFNKEEIINDIYTDVKADETQMAYELLKGIKMKRDEISRLMPAHIDFKLITKDIPNQVENKIGPDFVFIVKIETKLKTVVKAALIQAKKCMGEPNSTMKSADLKRLKGQVLTLNEYPERAGYLLFFFPSRWPGSHLTNIPKIRVMPSLDYSYFNANPSYKDISGSCDHLLIFL